MANDASSTGKAKAVPKTQSQLGGFNDFTLISKFGYGYRSREDVTVLPPGVLVTGSQNVLTNTHQRVGIRKGYTLYGEANTDLAPIGGTGGAMGVFDWETSSDGERNMRAGFLTSAGNDGKLQFAHTNSSGDVEWLNLLTGLTSVDFNYTTWWDVNTLQQIVLMVNGESNIRSWTGAVSEVLTAANPTGIIAELTQPGDLSQILVSGGSGYTVGDVLTLSGGGSNATLTVVTLTTGAITSALVNAGGTGWAVNDQFSIAGGTGGLFTAYGKVTAQTGGAATAVSIIGKGTGYANAAGVVCTRLSGTGAGLTIDLTTAGGAVSEWEFASDANHGTGYANTTSYTLTGGTGTGAHVYTEAITSGSITKEGTQTWAQAGYQFGTGSGTQTVNIGGVTYTYLSDDFVGDTTTLYGVTPDPSGLTPGALIIDAVKTWANAGGTDGLPADFKNQLIISWEGRVLVGSLDSAYLYLSDFTSFTSWDIEAVIVLNNSLRALVIQQEDVYVSTGKNDWYKVSIQLSADLDTRKLVVQSLSATVLQGARSQSAVTKIANSVAFLSFEPIVQAFGPVENIYLGPQMTDYSFPIINDMNGYDFTNACVFYYRKFIYVAVPSEGLVLIYNMTDILNPYWEAPQVLPIARFSVIEGELYGHSSQVSETYKLFTGYNDNGQPVAASAVFSFNNYGTRSQSKGYNEFYVEGYISDNTELTLGIQYDIDGCATETEFSIDGSDRQIVCVSSEQDNSLGKVSLGKNPIGSAILTSSNPDTPKFRVIKTFPTHYFYEDQISFSSEETDAQWEIISFGPQLQQFGSLNNNITQ